MQWCSENVYLEEMSSSARYTQSKKLFMEKKYERNVVKVKIMPAAVRT